MISHVESYSRIKLVVTSYLDKSGFGNIFTPYFDEFMNSQKYYARFVLRLEETKSANQHRKMIKWGE